MQCSLRALNLILYVMQSKKLVQIEVFPGRLQPRSRSLHFLDDNHEDIVPATVSRHPWN